MRFSPLFALAGLTLGVAACASIETPPAVVASGPQPLAGHDWFFNAEADEADLAYGLDETDDVWLDLSCQRGSGRLNLLRPVGPNDPRVISLESGGDTETYQAQTEPSELHEGVFLTSEAAASDPVFLRFRKTGWLAIYGDGYRLPMVPHPASADRIERFFAFCG